ncbi:MBL fold metallo-hydrolase [Pedobacter sp.]|uniref:MBL fold metallo-hydrolase n=1 Tax=Pedobacter sp. TaxID=1411316 RepID=UPI0031D26F6B
MVILTAHLKYTNHIYRKNEMKSIILESLGAAGTVTGSKHLLKTPDLTILVDCGLFQGIKSLREQNWAALPINPSSIGVILLTHAHLDHCGYIPLLVKKGFHGKIFMSAPTAELTKLILLDSAKLQEEEAEHANRQGYTRHHPARALYNINDANLSFRYFEIVQEDTSIKLSDNCSVIFKLAGHILGACSVMVSCYGKNILFSGDIGRLHSQILPAPDYFAQADFVVMESTYGDRLHGDADPYQEIAEQINRTLHQGGNVIIPSFAVGRAQELLYILYMLKQRGMIAHDIPIILDTPMGASASEISIRFADHYLTVPKEVWKDILKGVKVNKEYAGTANIVNNRQSKIVVAASGMLTGGRVLEYLKHDLGNKKNTILIIGFQAEGTRGRALLNGIHELKIHGRYYPVMAKAIEISGLSAHADQQELINWVKKLHKMPQRIFLVHGEPCAIEALRVKLKDETQCDVHIPVQNRPITLYTFEDDRSSLTETIIPNSDNPFAKY